MSYIPVGVVGSLDYEAIKEAAYKKMAAQLGITYEEYLKQVEAKAAAQASLPKIVCGPTGHIGYDMFGNEKLCAGTASLTVGTRKDQFSFGGKTTSPAKECVRVGVPYLDVPKCVAVPPVSGNMEPPHKKKKFKNLADPYMEWYLQQYKLVPTIEALGVPLSLVKEVAKDYMGRVEALNGWGGTEHGIKTGPVASNYANMIQALNMANWYNQKFEKRVADIATKYKAKITKVTAQEAAQAAAEEQLDAAVTSDKRKKLLVYGGAGLAAVAIGFLLT